MDKALDTEQVAVVVELRFPLTKAQRRVLRLCATPARNRLSLSEQHTAEELRTQGLVQLDNDGYALTVVGKRVLAFIYE